MFTKFGIKPDGIINFLSNEPPLKQGAAKDTAGLAGLPRGGSLFMISVFCLRERNDEKTGYPVVFTAGGFHGGGRRFGRFEKNSR
jgi:hypothetical protein